MEYILLQPLQTKTESLKVCLIERKLDITAEEESLILHEAGGPYSGFIVKKIMPIQMQNSHTINMFNQPSDLSFKLKVFMRHATDANLQQQEQRVIEFWFSTANKTDRMTCSNSFFHNLFKGDNFPKDYFQFLLRVMQIYKALAPIAKLKIDIEKIGNAQQINESPVRVNDPVQYQAIVCAKILDFLERAFPNTIAVDEIARLTETDPNLIFDFLKDLLDRNLVNYYDNGNTWIRNIINTQEQNTHEIINILQQPTVSNDDQPTIAIITVNYYEKLAVDAMMSNKVTFVRHKLDGESNVYTCGNIGIHRVVSTKLPLSVGRDARSAQISTGNTTTRLLGIFQRVDHVFLLGCAGGVPHYSDARSHPRRGDIVVSFPNNNNGNQDDDADYVYAHFEMQKGVPTTGGSTGGGQSNQQLISKSWMPASMELYRIVASIRRSFDPALDVEYPWEEYLKEGIESLYNAELDCRRPKEDKLFFAVGDQKNTIEVNHPEASSSEIVSDRRRFDEPMLRFGKIAGGEQVMRDENLRHLLSEQHNIVAFDSDLDQVMESIEGNRKDSFIVIRSIVDYLDGSTSKEWHPYASLCAAAFAKTIICALPAAVHTP